MFIKIPYKETLSDSIVSMSQSLKLINLNDTIQVYYHSVLMLCKVLICDPKSLTTWY